MFLLSSHNQRCILKKENNNKLLKNTLKVPQNLLTLVKYQILSLDSETAQVCSNGLEKDKHVLQTGTKRLSRVGSATGKHSPPTIKQVCTQQPLLRA